MLLIPGPNVLPIRAQKHLESVTLVPSLRGTRCRTASQTDRCRKGANTCSHWWPAPVQERLRPEFAVWIQHDAREKFPGRISAVFPTLPIPLAAARASQANAGQAPTLKKSPTVAKLAIRVQADC